MITADNEAEKMSLNYSQIAIYHMLLHNNFKNNLLPFGIK